MAASMENLIQLYFTENEKDASNKIATEIKKSKANLVQFIESLGTYLTNTDNVTRGRATQLIGDVLGLLPSAYLTQEEVEVMANFLLSKLSDHHSVQPHALQSLAVLTTRYHSLPEALVIQICQTIFREIQNQTLAHADRRATYKIMQNFLGSSRPAIEQMGSDFVIGFIQLMDAEKDPRNLILCFNIAHFIISNLQLGVFTEEMFEVLGCYFPIDFIPPPNDSHGITKKDLVEALRKCLTASGELAQYCLPLFLEKMTSDVQEARKDAFVSLAQGAPVYGCKRLTEFLGSLTSSLKREILMNISGDLVESARNALTAIFSAITPDEGVVINSDTTFSSSIVELYQDIVKYLEGSDLKKKCLAYSLCQSIASSSPAAFCVVTPLVLPTLIQLCSNLSQLTERLMYLRELKGFLDAYLLYHSNINVNQVLQENLPALSAMYEDLINNVHDVEVQLESIKALSIITTPTCCSIEKCEAFGNILVNKSLTVTNPTVRQHVLTSLQNVIKVTPGLGQKIMELLINNVNAQTGDLRMIVETMIHVVLDVDSFLIVNNFLLQKIQQTLTESNWSCILTCTEMMIPFLNHLHDQPDCLDLVVKSTALPLLCTAVTATLHWSEETKEKSGQFLSYLRHVYRIIGHSVKKNDVMLLWDLVLKLMLDGDTNAIGISGDFHSLKPLSAGSSWQQTRLTAVLEGLLIGGDIQAMVDQRERIFEAAYVLAENTVDDFTQLSACRCVAVIFNKVPIGAEIHWLLEPMVDKLKLTLTASSDPAAKTRALRILTWLTKALESRGHSATTNLSSFLISILKDVDLGSEVAKNLALIVQDIDDVFSIKFHSNITPLYKQRFFTLNLKSLLEGYKSATLKVIKENHLMAVSLITSNLPLQVLKPHLGKLVPILLLSIDLQENESLDHILSTLGTAILHSPDIIIPNVDNIISQFLDLAKMHSSMKVRITALKCLENLTSLPVHIITPHQNKVVQALANTLDDKKRLVRKQAVDTRSSWILLEKAVK
ncbi:MMS19 nucleotide excision repair protein homolog [Physella acuta]|uniref:MMS19 nucleotide excision repair protein homolog n=1 Tax=Physella acuta TaxID=109671 RepID=UPI0027DC57FE|nr:MMS19 nucleotide excision repair protein homolog [Physella acuta]